MDDGIDVADEDEEEVGKEAQASEAALLAPGLFPQGSDEDI